MIIPRGVEEARITCHRALWCAFLLPFFFITRARLSLRGIGDFPGIKFAPRIFEYLFFSCFSLSKSLNRSALAAKRIPVEGRDYREGCIFCTRCYIVATTLDLVIKLQDGSFTAHDALCDKIFFNDRVVSGRQWWISRRWNVSASGGRLAAFFYSKRKRMIKRAEEKVAHGDNGTGKLLHYIRMMY